MKTNSGIFATNGIWFYHELRPYVGKKERRPHSKSKFRLETPHGDYLINTHSQRLKCFKRNPICAYCDRVGALWLLQKQSSDTDWCLNLYAIDPNDKLVLMTRDHIFPISRGGGDGLYNSTTSCEPCNKKNAAHIPDFMRDEQ